MKLTTKKLALCAVLTALALGLSTLESLFPVSVLVPLPGIKLGLANIVTVFALYRLGDIPALAILIARCLLGAMFAGNASALLFSLMGGVLAMLTMIVLRRVRGLSVYGVSIAGAAAHNIGQICAAMVVLGGTAVLGYLPVLLGVSLITGTLTGFVASLLFRAMRGIYFTQLGVKLMDRKDEIILQQMDLIRSMTERNLRSMDADFWGTPLMEKKVTEKAEKPAEKPAAQAEKPEQKEEIPPKEKIEDLLAELDGYVGMDAIKEEVRSLINMVQVYKLRRENDLPTTDMSLHMVFSGNPGTGKTTVARIMARIYHSLDILSKGQLVEVDRSGLVAGYVGQTALKTQKVIEKAMGGVLFIDEAYALNGKSENDFGQEAIDTILKAMEDHRDDLVVIVVGYTELMDRFIHSNPGLESRFNRFLMFEDYTPEQMVAIFKMQCKKGCYVLAEGTEELVRDFISEESADDSFGNARGVRNLFEHILVAQNNRLAKMEQVTREDLMQILPDDVLRARGKLDN